MAKLEGITVEINGDATGLNSALKDTNKELYSTQSELNQVNKLLKLDPSNITLLEQKQKLLTTAIGGTEQKLQTLKTAQEQANKSGLTDTEAGQKAYRELEREIASTEQALKKLSDQSDSTKNELGKTSGAIKNIEDASGGASNSTSMLGDIIKGNLASEAIITGVKALASAVGTVVSQMVNLGKQSIEAYADYEQLVGGVETLFKDSADVVQSYAANAYQTAGLSANEYMETVTSFSASLLQSLNNDTAKSAEVADMAITDMADNANKMGTSMSSIQNAYQGFAKQNYTMLDNLKLGYGGTKAEMERLLEDATKISGVDYDISSLSDVYNAIHVIQGELGITGTTALEASTTIQGSISAMKSSWQNLLVGMADGTQNMDELISNFVDSILTVGDNIIPRIEQSLDGIVELVVGLADTLLPQVLELGGELITKLIEGIVNNIGSITNSVTTVLLQFTQTLIEKLPQIVEAGITVIVSLINGITSALPTMIPTIVNAVILIVETLLDHMDEIITAGMEILVALIKGLIDALPQLIDSIPTIIDGIIQAITDNIDVIVEAGLQITLALVVGLIKAIPHLVEAVPKLVDSIVNGFKNELTSIKNIGKYIIEGLWNGILKAESWLINKIASFADDITDKIKEFFGIHSPSTVMRDEVGIYLAEGIGEGIRDGEDYVLDIAEELNDRIVAKEEELKERLEQTNLDETVKKNLESELETVTEFKKEYQSALNEITKSQEKMADKLQSLSKLFTEVEDSKLGHIVELTDLQDDIDTITEYGNALESLKLKEIPDDLLDEIVNMDVDDALSYMDELIKMTDEDYVKYIELWNQKQSLAEEVAKKFYKSEFDNLEKEFVNKLPTELSDIKSEMNDLGKLSAQGLGDGFSSQYGYIVDKMKSTLEAAYEEAKETLDIHSPSKLYAGLGKYMAQGLGVGFQKEMPYTIEDMANSLADMTEELSTNLDFDAMPTVNKSITAQNYYNTKTYQSNTEVVKQPSEVTIVIDKNKLGKFMIPVLDKQQTILGGTLA